MESRLDDFRKKELRKRVNKTDKAGWREHEVTLGSLPHLLVWRAIRLNDQGNELVSSDEGLLP